jgi:hypothetical protein
MTWWRVASLRWTTGNNQEHTGGSSQSPCGYDVQRAYLAAGLQSKDVSIVLEVLDNEHNLMCPTDRGNDTTVERDETERVDRECSNRDGNGPLHDHQLTLVQNPRRAWK